MAARSRTLLWGIVLVAVALRLPTLDLQSYWADEAATVDVVRHDLADLYGAVRDQESTPPLYYLLAWAWAQVLGDGEVGLRSLSALFGVLTVPVAGAVGARVGGERTGLFTALLAATSPLLVWFSQEARVYELLVLLAALSLLALLHAAGNPSRGRLLAWGLVAASLLTTHYFALFLVIGEVLWLAVVLRGRLRLLATALAPPALAGAALLPLALDQRSAGRATFIGEEGLGHRIAQVPKQFLVGYDTPLELLLGVAAAATACAALRGVVTHPGRGGDHRRISCPMAATPIGLMAIATLAGVLVPVALAALGEDYLVTRNVLAALVPLLVLLAAGAAALRPAGFGTTVVVILALTGLGAVAGTTLDDHAQREDWRDAVASLDAGPRVRAVVVRPGTGRIAAALYLDHGARTLSTPAAVDGIDVIAVRERARDIGGAPGSLLLPTPPVAGATAARPRLGSGWASQRFSLPPGTLVDPAALVAAAPGSAVLLVTSP